MTTAEHAAGNRFRPDPNASFQPTYPVGYQPGGPLRTLAPSPGAKAAALAAEAAERGQPSKPTERSAEAAPASAAPAPSRKAEPTAAVTHDQVVEALTRLGPSTATAIALNLKASVNQVATALVALGRARRAYKASRGRWTAHDPARDQVVHTEALKTVLRQTGTLRTTREIAEALLGAELAPRDVNRVGALLSQFLRTGEVERAGVRKPYGWRWVGDASAAPVPAAPTAPVANQQEQTMSNRTDRIMAILASAKLPLKMGEIKSRLAEDGGPQSASLMNGVSVSLHDLRQQGKADRTGEPGAYRWFAARGPYQPPAAPPATASATPSRPAAPRQIDHVDELLMGPPPPAPSPIEDPALEAGRLRKLAGNWIAEAEIREWLYDLATRIEALQPGA